MLARVTLTAASCAAGERNAGYGSEQTRDGSRLDGSPRSASRTRRDPGEGGACGACRTDLHVIDGELPGPQAAELSSPCIDEAPAAARDRPSPCNATSDPVVRGFDLNQRQRMPGPLLCTLSVRPDQKGGRESKCRTKHMR